MRTMCEAKPGRRCDSGATKAVAQTKQKVVDSLATADPRRSQAALLDYQHALYDYYSTKAGKAELSNWDSTGDADHHTATARILLDERQRMQTFMPPAPDEHDARQKADRRSYGRLLEDRAYALADAEHAITPDREDPTDPGPDNPPYERAVAEMGRLDGIRAQMCAEWGWAMPDQNRDGDTTSPIQHCPDCGQFVGSAHSCEGPDDPVAGHHQFPDQPEKWAPAASTPTHWDKAMAAITTGTGTDPDAGARLRGAADYMLAAGHRQCPVCGQFCSVRVDNHDCPGTTQHAVLFHYDPAAEDDIEPADPDFDLSTLAAEDATTGTDASEDGERSEVDQDALLGELDVSIRGRVYSDIKDRDERAEAIKNDLRDAISQIVESGKVQDWLDAMTNNGLGRWSFNNRLLAMVQGLGVRAQLPEDHEHKNSQLMVMSAADWKKKYGRFPAKGSKAIWIQAPVTRKITETDPKTGREETRVVMVGTRPQAKFDVSQTDGKPLPDLSLGYSPATGEVRPGIAAGLVDRVKASGYSYQTKEIPGCNPTTGEGTFGYTDPKTKQVVLDSRLSPSQRANTLAHELAHIKCGHVDDLDEYRQHRGRMETEAEAAAYMVTRWAGMSRKQVDSCSASYITGWSRGKPETVEKALAAATAAFNSITDGDWPDQD